MSNRDQNRLEILRAKIQQRKDCEKKAFETCMVLIDNELNSQETLIDAVIT